MTDLSAYSTAECYGITEWCSKAKFSPALFFKLRRAGTGPKVTRIGARTIVVESPREYYARREQEMASAPRIEETAP
jgi:hypothetical protein